MAVVANHDDVEAFLPALHHFNVHLLDQRACGVKDTETAFICFFANCLGDAVRAEHERCTAWHFGKVFDEHGTFFTQVIDDKFVVNDFVAHVDWSAVFLQRAFDNLDGTINPGAKAARVGE